jgi:hypothetical protein
MVNLFGYSLRVNAAFRYKIQQYVDQFRASSQPPFYHNTSCVWLHARKNDRMLPPSEWDMLDWCRQFMTYNTTTKQFEHVPGSFKVWKNDTAIKVLRSATLANYGCKLTLPYGAASLEHFINASLVLSPNAKTLFLSTDDEAWVSKAISEYLAQPNNLIDKLKLTLHYFNPPSNHRSAPSIDIAAMLFATIELGRQCEGFVGHLTGSAVAQFFYESMCYHHNGKYLSCPPLFDLAIEMGRQK